MAGMSFNATTSKLEHTTATGFDVTAFTLCCYVRCNGRGENNGGRIITVSEVGPTTDGWSLGANLTDQFQFLYTYPSSASSSAQWTWAVLFGGWRALSLTYDRSSTANDPVPRNQYAAAGVTEGRAPVGSPTAPASGYCIGNRAAQDRTWDGGLMHLQFHPSTLSTADQDKANRYPGSVRVTGSVWWPMLTDTYTRCLTWNGSAWVDHASQPTATALSTFTTDSPSVRPRRLVPQAA